MTLKTPKDEESLRTIGLNAIPSLVKRATSSDDAAMRASAVKALAAIALSFPDQLPPEALNALKCALDDPDLTVHLATVSALSTLGQPAFAILTSALETEDIARCVAIISALGSLGDPRGIEVLTTIATNETADPYLRESATSALSRLEQILQFKSTQSAQDPEQHHR